MQYQVLRYTKIYHETWYKTSPIGRENRGTGNPVPLVAGAEEIKRNTSRNISSHIDLHTHVNSACNNRVTLTVDALASVSMHAEDQS